MKQSQTFSHYYQMKHQNLFIKTKILIFPSTFLNISQLVLQSNITVQTIKKMTGLHMK